MVNVDYMYILHYITYIVLNINYIANRQLVYGSNNSSGLFLWGYRIPVPWQPNLGGKAIFFIPNSFPVKNAGETWMNLQKFAETCAERY